MRTAAKPQPWAPGRNRQGIRAQLWRGCVGLWPMWMGAGPTAYDLSPHRNHASLANGVSYWATSYGLRALEFTSTSHWASLPSYPTMWENTLSAWLYRDDWNETSSPVEKVWFGSVDGDGGHIGCRYNSGQMEIGGGVGLGVHLVKDTSGESGWNHLVIVQKDTTRWGYWNGVQFATITDSNMHPLSEGDTGDNERIGNNSTGVNDDRHWSISGGDAIAAVTLWDRPLQGSEVRYLHTRPWAMIQPPDMLETYAGVLSGGAGFQPAWARGSNRVINGG